MKPYVEELEKNFILYQSYLQVIIVLYAVFYYFNNERARIAIVGAIFTLLVFFIRIFLVRTKYFRNKSLYNGCKVLIMLIYGVFFSMGNAFVQAVAIILYSFTYIELMLIREPEIPSEKQNVLIMGTVPLMISFVININVFGINLESLFVYALSLFYFIGLTYFICFYITAKNREQDDLKKEIKTQNFEKESLKLERSKYKLLHNAMAKQKFELEQKNAVLNRVSAEMYTQAELLRYISSVLDIEELIGLVTDSVIGAIGVDTCMLVIHDQDSGKQYYKVNTSIGKDLLAEFKQHIGNGLFKEYFTSGKPFMDSEVNISDYDFISDREVGSLIIVPLIRMDVTYGLLIAEHRTTKMFDVDSVNFFKSITSQISIAVNNANIYSKMEEMAVKDGLTGLYNRREVQKMISDLIFNRKEKDVISLALFDIDKFKRVNDTYGHLFGDEAIKAIAELAKKYSKEHDGIAGRYGGEEFVFVLPGKSLEEAEVIMKNFHDAIQDIVLLYDKTKEVKINVSLGVSACPTLAHNTEELLSRADNAMYYAKKNGRGQVIVDHENFGKII